MSAADGGPYVQVATFSEKIIRGAESGALSVINILDSATVVGEDPDDMPAVPLQLTLVVNLWAGQSKGRFNLSIRPEAPSGIQGDPINIGPVHFTDSGAKGVDTIVPFEYEVAEEGAWWFDVLFSPGGGQQERVLSRIPFTVRYQPQQA